LSYNFETLQDFALGLLQDDALKAAYDLDPTGVLADAGLADLTDADVQEILPLVADGLPTDGLPTDALGDLTTNFDGTVGDVLGQVALDNDSMVAKASTTATDDAATLSAHSESALGNYAGGAKLNLEEFGGSVAGQSPLGDFAGGLVGHGTGAAAGEFGGWAGVDSPLGDVAAGGLVGPHGADLALESPLGNYGLSTDGGVTFEPANPADVLDNLGDTGDQVIGTAAHLTDAGSETLAGTLSEVVGTGTNPIVDGITQGGDLLSEQLTSLPVPPPAPADLTGDLPVDLPVELPEVGDLPVGDLPVDGLPGLDSLPLDGLPGLDSLPLDGLPGLDSLPVGELPVGELPVGDLPVGDLPVQLPELPVSLPTGVPSVGELPDASQVTDVLAHNPVTDAVSASPVGDVVDGVTDQLPVDDVTGVVDDLNLGL
jgi:hypothetical protein